MPARRTLAAVLVACAALGACSDDDNSGADDGSTYSVAGSLEQLPAAAVRDNPALVVSGDLDRASQLAGVERPTSAADSDAVIEWAMAISGGPRNGANSDVSVMPLDALRFERLNQIDEIDDELGWSILDVTSYAGVDSPPEHLASLTGDFDTKLIDAAQGDRNDGIWSLGDDDFTIDVKQVSAAPPLGSSVRTAVEGGRLGESASTPTIEAWLAGKDTLADDEAMRDVAEALDDHDVYSAVIVSNVDGLDADDAPSPGDEALEPSDAFAAGAAHDGDGAQVVIAVRNADDDAADRNTAALRTLFEEGNTVATRHPWSDLVTVADVDVDGRVVVVTLDLADGRPPTLAYQWILTREPFTIVS